MAFFYSSKKSKPSIGAKIMRTTIFVATSAATFASTFILIISVFSVSVVGFYFVISAPEIVEAQTETELEEELAKLERDRQILQNQLNEEKSKTATIQRDVNILEGQIKQAELNIRQKNLEIERLRGVINLKEDTIDELNEKIRKNKEILSELIRRTNDRNQISIPEIILSSDSLTDFFVEVDSFSNIQRQLQELYSQIMEIRGQTEFEKEQLAIQQNKEVDARYEIQSERQVVAVKKDEHTGLLNLSKQNEATYQDAIRKKEQEIARIRAELIKFQGSGVVSREISFGEAYDYAKSASQKTGVRSAFIMAIMQQETGFGSNVGGCNVRDGATGEGIYIRSGNVSQRNMVPGNFDNFVKITGALGLDWRTTPISCAQVLASGQLYGYGGAMGYTQFIPNTWMGVEARVREYLGASVADPWNPQHAVMATAIFLRDLGAAAGTYSSEYGAACRYYGTCAVYDYGSSVMSKAANIQISINTLEGR